MQNNLCDGFVEKSERRSQTKQNLNSAQEIIQKAIFNRCGEEE